MKSLQVFCAALLLCSSLAVQATETGSGDPRYTIQNPPAYAMLGDLLIARPLLVVATVIGAGAFVVSLPFTALGGGIGDAGQALVVIRRERRLCGVWGYRGRFEQRGELIRFCCVADGLIAGKPLPQVFGVHNLCSTTDPVGAGLPAMASVQARKIRPCR